MEVIMNSLLTSFRRVPPAAIPVMLDCILSSTNFSPSSLFSSLLSEFPTIAKEITEESNGVLSEQPCCVGSYVSALCHLLKKSGANLSEMKLFIWRILIPFFKLTHSSHQELFNEVASIFFDTLLETNSWVAIEETLVPFLFRLVGSSIGLTQKEETAFFSWSSSPSFHGSDDQCHSSQKCSCVGSEIGRELIPSQFDYFPLPVSCEILSLTLDASVQWTCVLDCTTGLQNFTKNFLWDLSDLSLKMLLQSLEHRASAISILLPSVLKAFGSNPCFEVSVRGQSYVFNREALGEKIWTCCKTLFSLGLSERRDAFTVLSLYLSSGSLNSGIEDGNIFGTGKGFDLSASDEFWDEVRKGLVDEESLTRKQSLHVLKSTLRLKGESCNPGFSDAVSGQKDLVPRGMTKRERWANEEAKSLGVGKINNSTEDNLNSWNRWETFTFLYEMLEEYGTHLVEAAWNHQMNLLLHSCFESEERLDSVSGKLHRKSKETWVNTYEWLPVLWERGFCHDNPQVRCLIMQSFLGIAWKDYGSHASSLPEEFVLGPLMEALNDPVHHKDFGCKQVYSSSTIDAAASFFCQYCSYLDERKQVPFLSDLASVAKKYSFGRPGLMCLAECVASAAHGIKQQNPAVASHCYDPAKVQCKPAEGNLWKNDRADLLEFLRFIIESSKQHFNPHYRFQVCERILDAATLVMTAVDVPLEMLLLFISCLPREVTDLGGSLRFKVQKWLSISDKTSSCSNLNAELLANLYSFPRNFVYSHPVEASTTFDDEDIDSWDYEATRWARVLFLVNAPEQEWKTLYTFLYDHGSNICKQHNLSEWMPVKFLILLVSLIQELQLIQDRAADGSIGDRMKADLQLLGSTGWVDFTAESRMFEKFAKLLNSILEELLSFAESATSIFWSSQVEPECNLPSQVTGKLGGPSRRRLSSNVTTSILKSITSLKSLASITRWCVQFTAEASLNSVITFLWNFCWKTITTPSGVSERDAEISLGAYEALSCVLKDLITMASHLAFDLFTGCERFSVLHADAKPSLDVFVQFFLQNVNTLISTGNLVRSRRAVLFNWKWICLEYLLSFSKRAIAKQFGSENYHFSDNTLRWIFCELVESLENAGETSALPILRSVRLNMELFALKRTGLTDISCDGLTVDMMWNLVKSSWILHLSCNKRRVAPIAALISSVLHYSVFGNECMHAVYDAPGPLKWFIEKILEEGTKSPRTVRLAALHLTGLWLENPSMIRYYLRELKLLTMYGSIAFDEDFESELAENQEAKNEVLALSKSPGSELTEVFINTELYARVSVAVLFCKLADMADAPNGNRNSLEALASGKMFLLELLQSALVEKDLSKELYKKHSAIHRRKIRVWQMICILSRFVYPDNVEEVTFSLHTAIQRNNLPSVRQYMETIAINIYLKFPLLVGTQLVPLLKNYDIRPQALSSYVFIAANVILHADIEIQSKHLDELLPPIIPLLTSHHHTLRGFTQLLVYQILQKLNAPTDDSVFSLATLTLEKRCFRDLQSYLTENPDCARLRTSMEGYLDAFNPKTSITPAGIFINRVEQEFECVPKTLMDQVTTFLNDTRDDLRISMARDAAIIKNEGLFIHEQSNISDIAINSSKVVSKINQQDLLLDFQKKFTLSKHETQPATAFSTEGGKSLKTLADMEKEDQLLDQLLHSGNIAVQKLKASRQHLIIVASLVDRVPNLAGLARTCEVFRAAGLAIADKSILNDKQFQLISVTAEKWVPIIEVPVSSMKSFLEKKKHEGYAILGLEQTANSKPLDQYAFPTKSVLVLGREKEGIPVEIIHILDACIEIPQLGVVRSLNVHVSGAIAIWEYTRQQRLLS
ncbi:OLC1v1031591C1 [Oldenlandia corymbosa var. corymbosa]|uniref:tRNA (guanosine(18)-2'-O)-methyltransferase TARBP1 n=1 Tax=Oldenlandia corymbosa var. corymbosa TaxID=529605 RepID=A0AAV1CKN2_OLDCO|nr:OLC1v1031591C1 [Oldenlandia corymbosa var. corymbosa]